MKKIIMAVLLLTATQAFGLGAYITKTGDDWVLSNQDSVDRLEVGSAAMAVVYIDNTQYLTTAKMKQAGYWLEVYNYPGYSQITFYKSGTRTVVDPATMPDGTLVLFGKYANEDAPKTSESAPKKQEKQYKERTGTKY